jgi:hypothetical protein
MRLTDDETSDTRICTVTSRRELEGRREGSRDKELREASTVGNVGSTVSNQRSREAKAVNRQPQLQLEYD